ncbi:MAG: hypothetical protein HC811_02125 [Flammeovirgaceae bacterium]|nr:hypothetical protein [Flammeovirgaceae bacterium]
MRKVLMLLVCVITTHILYAQNSIYPDRSERLFVQGEKLMAQKEYGAARRSFEEFLESYSSYDSKRGSAEYYKAVCALMLFHLDGEKLMDDFIEQSPHHPKSVIAYSDLANFYYQEKNYSRASQYYSKVDFRSLSNEQQIEGRFHWGYSLFNQKKLKEALEQFNYYKVTGGQYGPASSYYAGFIEFGNDDYENALIDFKRAGQSPSYELIVPVMIANVHYKKKDFNTLLAYIDGLTNLDDVNNKEELVLLKAEAYYKKADYSTALKGYKEYLEGRERYADKGVLFRAGYAAFQTKLNEDALDYFKSAATTNDSIKYYASYYIGILYLQQNQKLLALTAFDLVRSFKSNPGLVEESIFQFAKISYDLGLSDQSIKNSNSF